MASIILIPHFISENTAFTANSLLQQDWRYLLWLVFFCTPRWHKTFRVHFHGFASGSHLRCRVPIFHPQKWKDVEDLWLVGAVCHGFALRCQDAGSHPLCILVLLKQISEGWETQIQVQSATLLGTDQDVSSQLYNTQNCQLLSEARGEVPHVLSGCQSPTLTPNRNWVFWVLCGVSLC